MAIHRRLDSFSLIFYLLLILWVKTELHQSLPPITSGFQLLRSLPDKESSKLQLQEPFVQLSDKKVVSITNRLDRIGTITVLFSDKEEGRTISDFDWNSKEWTDYTDLSDMPYNSVVWAN